MVFLSPIKETIDVLAAAFFRICNMSFEHGVFPDKLKFAKILTFFKMMTLLCSQTIGLFVVFPVFLRS